AGEPGQSGMREIDMTFDQNGGRVPAMAATATTSTGHAPMIVGAGTAKYERHPAVERRTETFIAEAVVAALADAGIDRDEVDGFGVASFSLAPDHAIDMAWKLGMTL